MRIALSLNLLVASVLLPAPAAVAQTWTDFQVGGLTRKALVYVPSGVDNPPLLLSLHGMGIGAGWHQDGMMKFEPIADREKFIVVYPEADRDLRWDLAGTHDIDFMLEIIEQMSTRHGIDRNRVYASGFSMGGMFSYTLACKIPDKIAAIAPGDGYPLGGERGCVATRSVPIFHMHGTADDFVKYSTLHAFLDTKIAAYGCPTTAVRTEPYPRSNPASRSFKEYWGPCTNGAGRKSEIVLISVTGMIHDWATEGKANANEDPAFAGKPFDIDGSEEAWAFLKTHSLADTSSGGPAAGSGGSAAPAGAGGSAGADASGTAGAPPGGGAVDAGVAGTGGAATPATTPQGDAGAMQRPGGTGGPMQQPGGPGVATPQGGAGALALPDVAGAGSDSSASSGDSTGCACIVVRASGLDGSIVLVLGVGALIRYRSHRRRRLARSEQRRALAFGRLCLAVLLVLPTACGPEDGVDGERDQPIVTAGTGGASGGGMGGGVVPAGSSAVGGAGGGGSGGSDAGGVAGSSAGSAADGGVGGSGESGAGGVGGSGESGAGGVGGAGSDAGGVGGSGGSSGSAATCPLPTSFRWTSSGPLAQPQSPPNHDFVSLKDFTIVKAGDAYAMYATAFDSTASWTGVYIGFSDFSELGAATQTWLGSRATVAPQLMYFTPKDIWVLTYQWGFQYATGKDPHDPDSWSRGSSLLTGNPTMGHGGTGPIDQTVICDSTHCYLFFAGDNGRIYRGSMPIENFPAAFTNSAQIMQDTTANLFEGIEVYSVEGSDEYLMIVEAMGSRGRYFRAFTADRLGGTFTAMPQASSQDTPFAGKANVTFDGAAWTNDISHGDLVREDPSEKKPIDPCNLRLLYQGRNPAINVEYGLLPYRPGLLTLAQ